MTHETPFSYTDCRFADLQMLRYRLDGFSHLSLPQKLLVYYLSEAALWGRDIIFDQCGRHNLRIRKALEAIYTDERVPHKANWHALQEYLYRVWFSHGIHHHYGCHKFQPEFSPEWFRGALKSVDAKQLPLRPGESINRFSRELVRLLFRPDLEPMRVNQTDGDDLVATSACNFYAPDITQAEAEAFYAEQKEAHPQWSVGLNTYLTRDADGQLSEEICRIGGRYDKAIRHIVEWLEKAKGVAENEQQRKVIALLISYYQSGSLQTFDEYSIEWLKCLDGGVDFINGFIEVYGDPLGLKGSWEGLVEYVDEEATNRVRLISNEAQWFEDHSPIDPRFRKPEVKGVTARVIRAAMLGGDEYPATAIGINLPNADWIRAQYGSKSISISNITDAYNKAAAGSGMREEFVCDAATRTLLDQYSEVCDELHTHLHECLGHGSGQLLPGVDRDALKAYGNTIEEARADLFGLYYVADKKLVELGLTPNAEAWHAGYYAYMLNGLITQLVRIEPGHHIEEAHMRNRALIARWCLENGHAMHLEQQTGKTYLVIDDYNELRKLIATLLAEVQRIKSEGDYAAARELVERYGVHIDAALHQEVLERYSSLGLAPYKGFINPVLRLVKNKEGEITDVSVDYTESYEQQMLRYSRDYASLN